MAIQERELEKQLKALANRRRLAILKHLKRNSEATVADIAKAITLSFKATSKHLRMLTAIDILEREQRNVQMFYRLATAHPSAITHLLSLL